MTRSPSPVEAAECYRLRQLILGLPRGIRRLEVAATPDRLSWSVEAWTTDTSPRLVARWDGQCDGELSALTAAYRWFSTGISASPTGPAVGSPDSPHRRSPTLESAWCTQARAYVALLRTLHGLVLPRDGEARIAEVLTLLDVLWQQMALGARQAAEHTIRQDKVLAPIYGGAPR